METQEGTITSFIAAGPFLAVPISSGWRASSAFRDALHGLGMWFGSNRREGARGPFSRLSADLSKRVPKDIVVSDFEFEQPFLDVLPGYWGTLV